MDYLVFQLIKDLLKPMALGGLCRTIPHIFQHSPNFSRQNFSPSLMIRFILTSIKRNEGHPDWVSFIVETRVKHDMSTEQIAQSGRLSTANHIGNPAIPNTVYLFINHMNWHKESCSHTLVLTSNTY
jgi:hypothetical protein